MAILGRIGTAVRDALLGTLAGTVVRDAMVGMIQGVRIADTATTTIVHAVVDGAIHSSGDAGSNRRRRCHRGH